MNKRKISEQSRKKGWGREAYYSHLEIDDIGALRESGNDFSGGFNAPEFYQTQARFGGGIGDELGRSQHSCDLPEELGLLRLQEVETMQLYSTASVISVIMQQANTNVSEMAESPNPRLWYWLQEDLKGRLLLRLARW